jgi:hypothetical protein
MAVPALRTTGPPEYEDQTVTGRLEKTWLALLRRGTLVELSWWALEKNMAESAIAANQLARGSCGY